MPDLGGSGIEVLREKLLDDDLLSVADDDLAVAGCDDLAT